MKTSNKIALLLLAVTFLYGCSFIPNNLKNKAYDDLSIEPLTRNINDYTAPCSKEGKPKIDCALEKDPAIMMVLEQSNQQCTNHLRTIYGNDAAFNISTGSMAMFTSGWSAISSGGQAKLLAALSTFANGERALVNETVYKNILTTSIGIKISEMRETKGNAIRSKIGKNDYTEAQATYDLLDYHDSCSFYVGLQQALKEGTNNTPELKRSQLEAKRQTLINQIVSYANLHNINDLKKSDENNKDPIYKSLVDELASIDAELTSMRSPNAQASEKSSEETGKPPTNSSEKVPVTDKAK